MVVLPPCLLISNSVLPHSPCFPSRRPGDRRLVSSIGPVPSRAGGARTKPPANKDGEGRHLSICIRTLGGEPRWPARPPVLPKVQDSCGRPRANRESEGKGVIAQTMKKRMC
ncbi:hypothetical protein LX36DRAFT_660581 [Colletotrichum falcatum]|nr:hypothetical protein LX36DRAFT_660581 [Colletotrichum falcatum]